jgi:hypothetical protein
MVKIDSTKFGEIVIDGKTHYSDVIVFWDGTINYREKDRIIDEEELSIVMEKKINILVVGTGQHGVMSLSGQARMLAVERKIKVFELQSPYAIDIFNGFASSGRKVAAIIHTTG